MIQCIGATFFYITSLAKHDRTYLQERLRLSGEACLLVEFLRISYSYARTNRADQEICSAHGQARQAKAQRVSDDDGSPAREKEERAVKMRKEAYYLFRELSIILVLVQYNIQYIYVLLQLCTIYIHIIRTSTYVHVFV